MSQCWTRSVIPDPTPVAIRIYPRTDRPLPPPFFLHLQASEPEQTTSDPLRAAAAPFWDLICSIFELVPQKTPREARLALPWHPETNPLPPGDTAGRVHTPASHTPCCAEGLPLPACVVDVRPQASLRALQFWLRLRLWLGL